MPQTEPEPGARHQVNPAGMRAGLWRQRALTCGVVGVIATIIVAVAWDVRIAGVLLAATLAALGILRAILPTEALGALAIRSRLFDVFTLTSMAVVLLFLTFTAPNLS